MLSNTILSYKASIILLQNRVKELGLLLKLEKHTTNKDIIYDLNIRRNLIYTEIREMKDDIRAMELYTNTIITS